MGSILKAVCGVDTFGVYRVVRRVNDSAPRRVVRRVKDSASDAELVRFAKDHDDWNVLNRAGGKKEIHMSLDNSHYAAIIAKEGDDAEYEVRFGGFSDDVDSDVRNYTDLERAVHFAYGRGNDLLKQVQESEVDDARRRSVKDNRRVRWVRDARGRLVRKSVKDDAASSIDDIVKFLESQDGADYIYIENIDAKGANVYADIRYMDGDDEYTADLEIFLDDAHVEVALSFYEGGIYAGSYIVEGESSQMMSLLEDVIALLNRNDGVASVILEIFTTDMRKGLRLMPRYRELFEGYAAKQKGAVTDARKQKGVMVDARKKPHKAMLEKAVKDTRRIRLVRDSRGRLVRK